MKSIIKNWMAECVIIWLYFFLLVFAFLPVYLTTYSYLLGNTYIFSSNKLLLSMAVLFITNISLISNRFEQSTVYELALRLFYLLSFVPMLALYCCGSKISVGMIFEPGVFGALLLTCLYYYSTHEQQRKRFSIKVSPVLNADLYILIICGLVSVFTWALAGFPLFSTFNEGYEQRMALRQNALPTIVNYLYTMAGGALLPYLFTRNLISKNYFRMIATLFFGMLLFFVNGMKTWFFLYIFAIAIYYITSKVKTRLGLYTSVELGVLAVVVISLFVSVRTGALEYISQIGRVIIIPNNIGFKFIDFFRSNELLYLRESIFRSIWRTPYEGGSDFYINYGVNTTLTSSRANNGLFGDAYRNFGIVGIIVYPFLISKVINIIERNCRYESITLRYYIMFILIWGSMNTSFFTWLLTGGIIVLYILLKIYRANAKKGALTIERNGQLEGLI